LRPVSAAKPFPVTIISGAAGSSTFGAALPAAGTPIGFSDGTNLQAPRVFDADSGGGTQYVPGAILRKSASGGSVEAGTSADPLRVDPTGTTTQPVNLAQVAGTTTVTGGVAGSVGVAGLAASGATKSGNPVQTGLVFNTTMPIVTTGQVVEAQATSRGAQIVATGPDSFFAQSIQFGAWTVDTELPAAAALSDAMPNPTTPLVGASNAVWDGSGWRRVSAAVNGGNNGIYVTVQDDTSNPLWVFPEDSVHVTADAGVHVLGVRRDADTSPVSATGDYHSLILDELGHLKTSAGPTVALQAATSQGTGTEADIDVTVAGLSTVVVRMSGSSGLVTTTDYSFFGRMTGSGGNTHRMQGRDMRTGEVTGTYTGQKSVDRVYVFNVAGLTTFRVAAGVISGGTLTIEINGCELLNPAVVSAQVSPATPRIGQTIHQSVSFSASGENTLGPALTSGQTVRIMDLNLVFAGQVDATIKDSAGGTALTGAMTMSPGGSIVKDNVGEPHFISASGGAIVMNLSAAVQVSGWLKYTKGV
jgi:hypothetical protein